MKDRCIIIPAIKKNAVIPDQLVKKLAGIPLINRALATARACVPPDDVHVLTDSEEIGLICERAHVHHVRDAALRFHGYDIVLQMRGLLENLSRKYRHGIILRASCPLLTWVDIEDAWKAYLNSGADSLVTVREIQQRLWQAVQPERDLLLLASDEREGKKMLVESRALIMLNLSSFRQEEPIAPAKIIPWFLGEHSLEILNYQDWWICEKLLQRRHIVFVVAGFPAIGMGHVYRALMLAHEISDHKITFVCTRDSGLAVENLASRDYRVIRQGTEPLAETVLAQHPDLVINDFLDTPVEYMRRLREAHTQCVNFEDAGPGANMANLVINALYNEESFDERHLCGPGWFCLRDEFLFARRNPLRNRVSTLLITFGGTDQHDCTRRILDIVEPICRGQDIAIRIVSGPGYAHRENLEKHLAEIGNPNIMFTWATNIMSGMMEGADLAICSAGRTVYELAHMRVPGIVLATHEREARHTFARPRNGFAFAGIMTKIGDERIRNMFLAMLKQPRRARYWGRQNSLDFSANKSKVIELLLAQLVKDKEEEQDESQ